jgi:hypothetical protein
MPFLSAFACVNRVPLLHFSGTWMVAVMSPTFNPDYAVEAEE